MNVLKFKPYTEKELYVMKYGEPFPEEIHDFEVINMGYHTSAKGNETIKIALKFFSNDVASNKTKRVFDYFMLEGNLAFRLKDFLNSIGEAEKYFKGEFDMDEAEGKRGAAKLSIAPGTNGYPDSNKVSEYMPKDSNIDQRISYNTQPAQSVAPDGKTNVVSPAEFDDEIPF